MTTVLAIDTATAMCSVACRFEGRVFENTRSVERLHNEHLLRMLGDLRADAGFVPRDVQLVCFTAGPGSFTGIRIAAAAVQALAYAADALVLPVSSSWLLARLALAAQPDLLGVRTVLPSRRDHVYVCDYAVGTDGPRGATTEALWELERALAEPLSAGWRVVTAAAETVAGTAEETERARLMDIDVVAVTIRDLLDVACEPQGLAAAVPPELALPRYVEGDTPWQRARAPG